MQINVDVTDIDLNTVIGETVDYDEDGDGVATGGHTIADEVIATIVKSLKADDGYRSLNDRIKAIRDEVIRERVTAEVEATFEKVITHTNQWGEPTGKATSLTELILKASEKYLTSRDDSYHSRDKRTVVQKFLDEAVEKAIKTELAAAIVDEKAKVVAAVRAQAAELIAEAVKQGIGR